MLISIHTTLAGGDDFFFWETVSKSISIHTTLAGGDTLHALLKLMPIISIHTTLAGGDDGHYVPRSRSHLFQSTPPSRVAT